MTNIKDWGRKLQRLFSLFAEFLSMPKVKIRFHGYNDKSLQVYQQTYKQFNKLHRFKLFRNKTIGIELIDLCDYKDFEEYYKAINGKNSAAYYARKALSRKYTFSEICRNDFIDDIYEINVSSPERQGRKMDESYLVKVQSYLNCENYRYFGVLNANNKLVAYCDIGFFGDFASVNHLLGHKDFLNDGIMYLMLIEVCRLMFDFYKGKDYKYLMYDTYFGASEGLKLFKKKLGYAPYRVKWLWE